MTNKSAHGTLINFLEIYYEANSSEFRQNYVLSGLLTSLNTLHDDANMKRVKSVMTFSYKYKQ